MNRKYIILIMLFFSVRLVAFNSKSIRFKDQLSTYGHFNSSNKQPLWIGGRYIPQLNAEMSFNDRHLFDLEASANIYGNGALGFQNGNEWDGDVKPYRLWARYSSRQFEIRAGLQKINFGSASILRPLMWFDQIDPRDPLKLTDGVWGILGRYYFLNNANFWLWGLDGNTNTKGWEMYPTVKGQPEFGGRIQHPVPLGEVALTFHHRKASVQNPVFSVADLWEVPENRLGFDLRLDWLLGTWVEASWINKKADLGMFKNQEVLNFGLDYTIGLGSGLYIAFEQLVLAYDENAFSFSNPVTFSLLSMSYPVGLFDNLSAIIYYDWNNSKAYNFVNFQHQFNSLSLFLMGYWNPENYSIPTQGGSTQLFGGRGVQFMLVWNH